MPALAPVVEKLEEVPEPARQFYVQKDGKFHVDLSAAPAGFVPATELASANGKVVEFRDNNVKLLQEIEPLRKLKTELGDVDPKTAKEAVTELKTLKEKGVAKPDDINVLVTSAVQAAVKPLQEQLTQATQATAAERKRADDALLRSVVGEKFQKVGGIASAVDFIVGKAADAFEVKDGTVVAKANKFSPKNPSSPLSVEEWLDTATKDHDFAFKASTGAGAQPAGGGGGARPGQVVLKNPTPQQLGDPKVAKGLKEGTMRIEYD